MRHYVKLVDPSMAGNPLSAGNGSWIRNYGGRKREPLENISRK
jgi:hypothetical protein